eukprot:1157547-Pelagomonas_calceolata.AAC.1
MLECSRTTNLPQQSRHKQSHLDCCLHICISTHRYGANTSLFDIKTFFKKKGRCITEKGMLEDNYCQQCRLVIPNTLASPAAGMFSVTV